MIENNNYCPPQHVVEEWKKHCNCCPNCSDHPCDGVSAGGMCDNIECICDNDDYDYEWLYYDQNIERLDKEEKNSK